MKKYVLFDFDGTIADTLEDTIKLMNGHLNGNHIDIAHLRDNGFKQIIFENKIPFYKIPKILKSLQKEQMSIISGTKPFEGIINVIKLLSEKFILGIVSSNAEENVRYFLKMFDLEKYFKITHFGSPILGKKSVLKKVVKNSGVDKSSFIYVGDEDRDVSACKDAGMDVVAVSWGFNSHKRLLTLKPEYLISKPEQLLDILI